jgi:PhnB protein
MMPVLNEELELQRSELEEGVQKVLTLLSLSGPPVRCKGESETKIMSTTTNQSKKVEAYLFFNGRCEEAIGFYQKAIGATVEMQLRFKDSPEPCNPGMIPPGWENKVMHSSLRIGDTIVMASDGCGEAKAFDGFSLSLTVATPADAERAFAALGEGGKVTMPLNKTFWSPCFGMLTDKFGVGWMVCAEP